VEHRGDPICTEAPNRTACLSGWRAAVGLRPAVTGRGICTRRPVGQNRDSSAGLFRMRHGEQPRYSEISNDGSWRKAVMRPKTYLSQLLTSAVSSNNTKAVRTGTATCRQGRKSKAGRGENIAAAPCRREGACCNLDKNAVVVMGAHAPTQERSTSRPKLGIDLCKPPQVPTRVTPRNEQE